MCTCFFAEGVDKNVYIYVIFFADSCGQKCLRFCDFICDFANEGKYFFE